MAHNIYYNENTQKHSFFSVQQKAWHGLGTIVEDYPTSAEAIRFAGLDYQVERSPLFTLNSQDLEIDKSHIPIPDYYANLRTDTQQVLGVVSKDYRIVQNADAFSFFDSIVGSHQGVKYETAGALGIGERIFITAKLPEYIKVGRNDMIEQYLFLTTSHDGSGSITAAFTPVRIVCQNTLNAAMRGKENSIKIRHTANAVDRLRQSHQLMGITNQLATEMEELFNYWSKIKISDRENKKLIEIAMAPSKAVLSNLQAENFELLSSHYLNIVESVYEYSQTAPSQLEDTTRGTLYGTYNAVTGYFQNVRKFSNGEHKLKSIMQGTGFRRTQTAFDLCGHFAQYGKLALN